ncbi:hypothetical protein [Winogradskyella sp. MH6]|uniref:hypothetical protein n=1 Tax=Winogradskyella sp. MH6 TaxID=2929510 RepID=UPI001FB3EA22|nr:hypothetical protein [Winogradskyella sp. MH6]
MVRIYFDKQIFSNLFKKDKTKYVKLLDKIRNQRSSLFVFSHAHLLDLKSDKTDIKYSELDFIESIVGDNYLSYHAIEKRTSCYLATPNMAFKDVEHEDDNIDFASLLEFDTTDLNDEDKQKVEKAKKLLTEPILDFNFSGLIDADSEVLDTVSKILPFGKDPMSMIDWSEHMMSLVTKMKDDNKVWKGLRNITDTHFNNGKFTINYDEIDFNDELENSELKKTFTQFVNDNLNPNGTTEVTKYDFFVNAYCTLDLLGISKEPSKKFKFNNMMNDALHSYYGAYTDCVVSEDLAFLKKTRALYRLLGIETKVLHIDEFINSFDFIVEKEASDVSTFIQLLKNDLNNSLIINSHQSLDRDRKTETIKPVHTYLGFFNRIDKIIEDGKQYLYFYRVTYNYSYFKFYREYELVINNAFRIFGDDINFKGKFDWEKELELMRSDKWIGREWNFEDVNFKIENNQGSKEFSLLISFD